MTLTVAPAENGLDDGSPLILSSSLGTTSEMWEPQLEQLASRFRVITYDHRGHGKSPVPPGPYSLEDLGRDVLNLMDRLSIDRVNFAGLSLGGMVGMWLGTKAGDRINRLALLCTFAEVPSSDMWRQRAAQVRKSGTGSVADASIERWFTPAFRAAHPELMYGYREMVENIPDEGYAACCEAIEHIDIAGTLGEIDAPTLVISGSADRGATPEVGRALAEEIPGSRYAEVAAAHLANVEQPDEVTRLLLEHFSQ